MPVERFPDAVVASSGPTARGRHDQCHVATATRKQLRKNLWVNFQVSTHKPWLCARGALLSVATTKTLVRTKRLRLLPRIHPGIIFYWKVQREDRAIL